MIAEAHPAVGPASGPVAKPIRLLIVDDSAVARATLSRMIAGSPDFEIAASVPGADAALAFLASARVDIILLDIEMPGIDGLTALPSLLAASAGAHILVVSSAAADGATATMRALTLGATDTLAKPGTSAFAGRFAETLIDRLRRIGRVDRERRRAEPLPAFNLRPLSRAPIGCVAVGSSTGGLAALSELLRGLTPSFDAPILITQHLPTEFMSFFAAQIEHLSGRRTEVAVAGQRLQRGRILVAPGDGHLMPVRTGREVQVRIGTGRSESGCLPSVDPMLEATGEAYRESALAVILTGMGRDGTRGAPGLIAAGGEVVVQDRDSSTIWGMPGSVATAGLSSAVLRPRQIADLLMDRGSAA